MGFSYNKVTVWKPEYCSESPLSTPATAARLAWLALMSETPCPSLLPTQVYASNHSVHLYTTRDFVRWENMGAVFTQQTPGVLYRPHVVHNPKGPVTIAPLRQSI